MLLTVTNQEDLLQMRDSGLPVLILTEGLVNT